MDGKLHLIPDVLVPFLNLFTEPRGLAEAELALVTVPPPVAQQAWDYLVGRRLIRPEPQQPAAFVGAGLAGEER